MRVIWVRPRAARVRVTGAGAGADAETDSEAETRTETQRERLHTLAATSTPPGETPPRLDTEDSEEEREEEREPRPCVDQQSCPCCPAPSLPLFLSAHPLSCRSLLDCVRRIPRYMCASPHSSLLPSALFR